MLFMVEFFLIANTIISIAASVTLAPTKAPGLRDKQRTFMLVNATTWPNAEQHPRLCGRRRLCDPSHILTSKQSKSLPSLDYVTRHIY